MRKVVKEALECFESGFNCSQSIFSTYAPLFDVDRDTALKIAASFGGGIASMGQVPVKGNTSRLQHPFRRLGNFGTDAVAQYKRYIVSHWNPSFSLL